MGGLNARPLCRGRRLYQSDYFKEKPKYPEDCPDKVSFFPVAPDLARIRRWRSGVPCLELIVDGNVEYQSDREAYRDRDCGAEKNPEFSAVAPSA